MWNFLHAHGQNMSVQKQGGYGRGAFQTASAELVEELDHTDSTPMGPGSRDGGQVTASADVDGKGSEMNHSHKDERRA